MFLDNKYTNWYNNIISFASSRVLASDVYKEKHHIVPKSLGGSNDKSNLAVLTAKEHFICHLLLTKMTEGKIRGKLIWAFHSMCRKNQYQENRHIPSAARYEMARKALNGAIIGPAHHNYGRKLSLEEIKLREETKAKNKLLIGPVKRSEKARENMRKGQSNRGPLLQEIKNKISKTTKGRTKAGTTNGRHYFNDGTTNYIQFECPPGCVPGKIKKNNKIKKLDKNGNPIHGNKGVARPIEVKEKMKKNYFKPGEVHNNNQGKHYYNDGIRNYLTKECPPNCVLGGLPLK